MKPSVKLTLSILPGGFAVCRLAASAPVPDWANAAPPTPLGFVSITRTADELSIVCPDEAVPSVARPDPSYVSEETLSADELRCEPGWKCLKVAGPLDFGLTGIMAGLTGALAAVGVTVFTISTYDTDYLMVRHESLERALRALRLEGYQVHEV
jgi:hypothetical protein